MYKNFILLVKHRVEIHEAKFEYIKLVNFFWLQSIHLDSRFTVNNGTWPIIHRSQNNSGYIKDQIDKKAYYCPLN